MKLWTLCGVALACLALSDAGAGEGENAPEGVIVVIDAKTAGLPEGGKVKQIEAPKASTGKRALKDPKVKGKDQPRLAGIYVVKSCTITLTDGKTLKSREVLIAIEVGGQVLKDVKYVETFQATGDKGARTFHAYTAGYKPTE